MIDAANAKATRRAINGLLSRLDRLAASRGAVLCMLAALVVLGQQNAQLRRLDAPRRLLAQTNAQIYELGTRKAGAAASAENDGVVARALRKRPGRARAVPPSAGDELGEPTEYGRHILPDRDRGWGPIYYAVLRRVS